MSVLAREINNLLNSVYVPPDDVINRYANSSYTTVHGQSSNENEHVIEVPLVGITRDQLTVDVQEDLLTVVAKTESKSSFVKNFHQKWRLPVDADADNVSAKLENGLLTLTVPRVKPVKKVVNVTVN